MDREVRPPDPTGSLDVRNGRKPKPTSLRQSPYLAEALQVAYYHCVLDMPLKSIAEILGKSPATITRRLDEVRQAGWLRDRPDFSPPPDVWRELRGRMTCSRAEAALQERFGKDVLSRVTVLPAPVRIDSAGCREARPENVERIGLFAAHHLCEALAEGPHVVGVNWGWSVRHCVMNLQPSRPNPALRFTPLIGNLSLDESDPHFEEAVECSSNRLAQAAASAFGAARPPRLSTPAYIPRRFHSDAHGLRAIRDFIENDVSYWRIFGSRDDRGGRRPGLIDEVDTLVTGLTSLDVETLPTYRPGLITPEDLPVLQRAGVVGDLALHLVTDPSSQRSQGASAADHDLVRSINDLIVGASPEDFVHVAARARRPHARGLGVVVLASGPWKAHILSTAIAMGAVNELVTDLETATAMGRYLGIQNLAGGRL